MKNNNDDLREISSIAQQTSSHCGTSSYIDESEYEQLLASGQMSSRVYVYGMGWVLPEVLCFASGSCGCGEEIEYKKEIEDYGDDICPKCGNLKDYCTCQNTNINAPDDTTGGGGTGGGSSHGGGGNSGTGGTGGGNANSNAVAKTFPQYQPFISGGSGVRVFSRRSLYGNNSTLSYFTVIAYDANGLPIDTSMINGYFLERKIDHQKENISGSNVAIKAGSYKIIPGVAGQHYQWYLENVPGRSGIAIHSGNSYTDSQGCLLAGTEYDYVSGEYRVKLSRSMLNSLFSLFTMYGVNNIYISIEE